MWVILLVSILSDSPFMTCPANRLAKHVVFIEDRRSLSDDAVLFLVRSHVLDLFGDDAIADDAVRSFDEAKLVDLRKGGKRGDQTDVRTFRRFNRANPAVVARMDVAHFKACAFAVQAARPKEERRRLCVSSATGLV